MGDHSVFQSCCMKLICKGCVLAAGKRGMSDCPFCRSSNLVNDAEKLAMMMARVEKKDPDAINHLGNGYFYEMFGLQTNRRRAVELYTEAAELGSIDALHILGDGVQKDNGKAKPSENTNKGRGLAKKLTYFDQCSSVHFK